MLFSTKGKTYHIFIPRFQTTHKPRCFRFVFALLRCPTTEFTTLFCDLWPFRGADDDLHPEGNGVEGNGIEADDNGGDSVGVLLLLVAYTKEIVVRRYK